MRVRQVLAAAMVVSGALAGLPGVASAKALVPCDAPALVSAITAANAAGGGTIDLTPRCTYTLTAPDNGENGLPAINATIRINGNLATITRASSAADFRFFQIAGFGKLIVDALTLRNGRAPNGGAAFVEVGGSLRLYASTVTGNTATLVGGGGILNQGELEVKESTISNNSGSQGGGVNSQSSSPTTVTDSVVSGNHAVPGTVLTAGGGIAVVSGAVVLKGTRVIGNDATDPGAFGGGLVNNATLTVTGSLINNNIVTGDNASGGGVSSGGTLNITDSTVNSNRVVGTNARGGGISSDGDSTVRGTLVQSNRATGTGADAGGIYGQGGTVAIPGTYVSGNQPNNCGNPSTVPNCT